ncbi:MAG: hypothetical protein ABS882_05640 [Lysinibacillus sp.]
MFTFLYDTKPVYGDISSLKTMITPEDVKKFIRATAGNVYHLTLHNYLHSKSTDMILGLYKSARFAIQGNVFLQQNEFIVSLSELPIYTNQCDTKVIERYIALKNDAPVHLENDIKILFAWAKETLHALN